MLCPTRCFGALHVAVLVGAPVDLAFLAEYDARATVGFTNKRVTHSFRFGGRAMVVVRNVFRLKFGKAKEGVELWKEGMVLAKRLGFTAKSSRLLTDLVGEFYTVVFENTFDSLADFESGAKNVMPNPQWQAWYAKVTTITESGYREILNIAAEQ